MIIQFAQSLYLFCNLVSFTHHTLTCTLPSFPSLPSSSWECSWGLPIRRPSAFLSCMYSPMTLLLVCLTYYKLSRVPLPNSFHPSVHEDQPTAVNCVSFSDFVQWDNGNIILLPLKKKPQTLSLLYHPGTPKWNHSDFNSAVRYHKMHRGGFKLCISFWTVSPVYMQCVNGVFLTVGSTGGTGWAESIRG